MLDRLLVVSNRIALVAASEIITGLREGIAVRYNNSRLNVPIGILEFRIGQDRVELGVG